ncbi:hypothetical protein [Candidatus Nitrotoga sp. M5]|uniref:hypothetical protein n=1 Tax=Candidatus Nitrotoga sp. M5 TaxID=2890409 RepID=UPI001EF57B1C|nr:hypothetical protein [Candidatus Nitrotoga sp. M5]CAH1387046.1 conserved hypothetical protein [Candidatus Nitrotoga sp. M5]
MNKYWRHPTAIGVARILFQNGQWHAVITDEFLGAYPIPEQALDDLVGGYTWSHSSGVDTSTLGLPDDLSEWELVNSTKR